jgi:hypothetical protein
MTGVSLIEKPYSAWLCAPSRSANKKDMWTLLIVLVLALVIEHNTVTAKECPERAIRGFPGFNTAPCYLYERFPTQFVTAERMW